MRRLERVEIAAERFGVRRARSAEPEVRARQVVPRLRAQEDDEVRRRDPPPIGARRVREAVFQPAAERPGAPRAARRARTRRRRLAVRALQRHLRLERRRGREPQRDHVGRRARERFADDLRAVIQREAHPVDRLAEVEDARIRRRRPLPVPGERDRQQAEVLVVAHRPVGGDALRRARRARQVLIARPQRIDIELHAFARDAARQHRAEPAVADWIAFALP